VDLNQVTVPCTDYDGTVRFYQLLGLRLIVDSPPRYARFETETGTTFSIHAEGMASSGADMTVYFEVDDVDATVGKLREKGMTFSNDPVDQEWLWREAYTNDPSGNTICIYHAGENRRYPPWRVD
jgi:catechol 2,3-dioxygenase-like lactoylglutathione lyase family enzyme